MNIQEASKRFRLDDKNLNTMLGLLDDMSNEIKTSKKRSMYHFKDIPITTMDGTEYQFFHRIKIIRMFNQQYKQITHKLDQINQFMLGVLK